MMRTPSNLILRALFVGAFFLFFLSSSFSFAADIEAILDSNDGGSSFVVKNFSGDIQGGINSAGTLSLQGNALVKGCLRVNGSLAACTQANSLIVDGNIGIGSANPRAGLDLVGSLYATSTTVTGTGIVGHVQTAVNTIKATNTNGLNLFDSTTRGISIIEGGNVGIGSASPASKLDVTGGVARVLSGTDAPSVTHATLPGSLYIQQNLEVDGNVYLGDQVMVDNIVVTGTMSLEGEMGYNGAVMITTDDVEAFQVRTAGEVTVFNVDTVNALTTQLGNMGIGSATPGSRLDVTGGAARVLSGSSTPNIGLATTPGSLYVQDNLEVDGSVYLGDAEADNLTVRGDLTLTGDTAYNGPVMITTTHSGALQVLDNDGIQLFNVDTAASVTSTMGNVGVGTTAPGQQLQIGVTANNIQIWGDGTGTNVASSGRTMRLGTLDGHDVNMVTNASNVMTLKDGGNVGIGSISPLSKLDVTGGAARVLSGSSTPNVGLATTPGSLYVQDNLEVDGNVYLGDATTDNLTVRGALSLTGDTTYNGPVAISTTHASALLVEDRNNVGVFKVDTEALNVGIGSVHPQARLDVTGGSARILSGASTPNIGLATTPGSLYVQDNLEVDGNVYLGDATTDDLTVRGALSLTGDTTYNGPVAISTTHASALLVSDKDNVGVFKVDTSAQNVGIGSVSPLSKLDVTGGAARILSGASTPNVGLATTPGSLYVQDNLEVDGNVYLGDVVTDALTVAGTMTLGGDMSYLANVGIGSASPTAQLDIKNNASVPFQVTNAAAGDYMVVTGAGCVGIGTTAPTERFELGTGYAKAPVFVSSSFAHRSYLGSSFWNPGTTSTLSSYNTLSIVTSQSGQNILLIPNAGNVGIGSTVPLSKLDVTGGAARILSGASTPNVGLATTPGSLYVQDNLEVDGNVYLGDVVTDALTVAGTMTLGGDMSYLANVGIGSASPTAQLDIKNNGSVPFQVTNEAAGDYVVVTSSGNVGVGTTRPNDKLNVIGNITLNKSTSMPQYSQIGYYGNGANYRLLFRDLSQAGNNWMGLITSPSGVAFSTGSGSYSFNDHGGNVGTKISVNGGSSFIASGNVGIGSTAPLSKLDVTGGVARILSGLSTPNVGLATTPGSLYVQDNLEVDGNVYLGDVVTDALTVAGTMTLGGNMSYLANVGIGSASPTAQLDIKNNGSVPFQVTNAVAGDYLTVTNAGLIGIGTTIPVYKLDIRGNVRTGTATVNMGLGESSGNSVWAGSLTNHPFKFLVNTNEYMRIATTGNVGVGSADPRSKLDVTGGAARILSGAATPSVNYATSAGSLYVQNDLEIDGNVYLGDVVTDALTVAGTMTLGGNMSYLANVGIGSAVPTAQLDIKNNNSVPFRVTNAAAGDYVVVTSSGYVGIGSANPAQRLDVAGNISLSGTTLLLGDGAVKLQNASSNAILVNTGAGSLIFKTADTERTRIDNSGNVGIGSTAPLSKLDVTGGAARILSGAASPSVNYATGAGSLYVQNDLEIDGNVYLGDVITDSLIVAGTMTLGGDMNYFANVGISSAAPTAQLDIKNNGSVPFQVTNAAAGDYMVVTSAGNVGIGSTMPSVRLSVVGDIGFSSKLYLNSTQTRYLSNGWDAVGSGNTLTLFSHGILQFNNNGTIQSNANGTLTLNSGTGNLLMMAGNVGIGSTAPLSKLDVTGGAARILSGAATPSVNYATGAGDLYVQNNLEIDGNVYLGDVITDSLTVAGTMTLAGAVNYSGNVGMNSATPTAQLDIKNNNTVPFKITNAAEGDYVTVTSAGRVGIGTAAPSQKLQVVGSANTFSVLSEGNVRISGDSNPYLRLSDNDHSYIDIIGDTGTLSFVNQGVGTTMKISYNGNVGIGTLTPLATLDIAAKTTGPALMISSNNGNSTHGDYLTVTSTGYVGVGTTAPNTKLHISATDQYSLRWQRTGAVTSNIWNLSADNNGAYVTNSTNAVIPVFFNNSGNVGIGSTAPLSKLDVTGGAARILSGAASPSVNYATGAGDLYVQNNLEIDGNVYLGDVITDSLTVAGTMTLAGAVSYTGNVGMNSAAPTAQLNIKNNGTNLLQVTNAAEGDYLTVTSAGNVGIGSTAPLSRLDVTGGLTRLLTGASAPSIDHIPVSSGSLYVQNSLEVDGTVYATLFLGTLDLSFTPGSVIFEGDGLTEDNANFFWDKDNRRLGIGTTVPQAALQVGVNPAIPGGASAAAAIKGDLVVDGNIYADQAVLTGQMIFTPVASSVGAGGIAAAPEAALLRVTGSGAGVDITADPQIASGVDGQELTLVGTSNTNSVKFDNGTGLQLAQGVSFTLGAGDILRLVYDGSQGAWVELARSDN